MLLISWLFFSDSEAQSLRFGLKAGAGMSNLDFSTPAPDSFDQTSYATVWYERKAAYKPSILLGGVLEYDLTKDFLLSTGINLNAKFSHVVFSPNSAYKSDYRLRLVYAQVPVNVHYRRGKLFLGAGGYVGFCALGSWKRKETFFDPNGAPHAENTSDNIVFGSDPEQANLKRLDAGVRVEIGYGFKTVRLSLAFDQGLLNNAPTGVSVSGFAYEGKLRHQAVYAMLTYYWLAK